jgi:hypothetical protein
MHSDEEAQMGKYVTRITYKGKEMLFMDTAGVSEEGGIAAWEEMKQELLKGEDTHLILVDGTGIAIAPGSVSKAKEAAAVVKRNPDNRVAFVGLTALQKSTAQLIAKGIHLEARFFRTLEEGKEWLVKEDDKRR